MMTNRFYSYANFSLGLAVAAGLLQSVIHFQLGIGIVSLQSISSWFFLVSLISLAASVFMLLYHHNKKHRFALQAGLLATAANFCVFTFRWLLFLNRELVIYTTPIFFLVVSAGIVYAISLIVSRAGERYWLKTAGVCYLILGLAQLTALILYIDFQSVSIHPTLDKIRQWTTLVGSLLPVLFILNFLGEAKRVKNQSEDTTQLKGSDFLMGLVVLLAICTLVLGVRIAGEGYGQTHVSSRAMELAQPFDAGRYVSTKGDTMLYRLLKPLHYDPQKKYPLVVCLPYSCADDNVRQIDGCPPAQWLSTEENRKKYPSFLFVPRCPPNTSWGGDPNMPSMAPLAIETIIALDKSFSIDKRKRYVTGVSRGGYGSWQFISTHPELFAAAIPICGEGDPTLAHTLTNVSVWAFHGEKDRNVPVSGSRDMIGGIEKAGGKPHYTEFSNAGHNIWEDVEKTPGLLDWLFAQQRNEPIQ
ncbi:carboxylesterase family protein [Spirosoma arcticum]